MKKNILILALAAVCAVSLFGCQAKPQTKETTEPSQITETETESVAAATTSTEKTAASAELSEEDAKEIALKDAGVSESDISGIRIEKDRDDGKTIYEVDFYVQNKEYDYDIDTTTGEIISRDYDIENDFSFEQPKSDTASVISKDDAVAIVLERISGAKAEDVRLELDQDDGRAVYEGELYHNQIEYEFELDASTGEVLEWSEEEH